MVTVGGSEAIDIAMRAMLDPGDEVLIPQPSYVSYEPCAILANGTPVIIELKEENEFRLTKEELEAAITPKTKLLVLPFPNNPTGAVMERKDLEEIAEVIKEHDVLAGVALNPATPLEAVEYILPKVDMVLLMTVNPGFGGQSYISYCTEKVRKLKEMIERQGLKTDIQVDGGINLDNVEIVMDAGANIIVAGSAVFKGDVAQNVQDFLTLMK